MKKELIELITTFPDRNKLNNFLFKNQVLLLIAGGVIGILIELLLNIVFPVWVGWIVFLTILIYIGVMGQKARMKVMKDYDEGKNEINKILKLNKNEFN